MFKWQVAPKLESRSDEMQSWYNHKYICYQIIYIYLGHDTKENITNIYWLLWLTPIKASPSPPKNLIPNIRCQIINHKKKISWLYHPHTHQTKKILMGYVITLIPSKNILLNMLLGKINQFWGGPTTPDKRKNQVLWISRRNMKPISLTKSRVAWGGRKKIILWVDP